MKKRPTAAELKSCAIDSSKRSGGDPDNMFGFLLFMSGFTLRDRTTRFVEMFNQQQAINPEFDISCDSFEREGWGLIRKLPDEPQTEILAKRSTPSHR